MMILDAQTVAARLPYDRLVPALRRFLARDASVPQRLGFGLSQGASLLLMPAWTADRIGVKLVNIFPQNAAVGLPTIASTYVLSDARTGRMLAVLDADTLTARRTAAAAALAASFLAPVDADQLLLVGAGHIARELPRAYASVRPIRRVSVWARDPGRAAAAAEALTAQGFDGSVARDLERAVTACPIIACATFSTAPLVKGAWLSAGAHLALIGGFKPQMREADSDAIRLAHVVADTREGVLAEAGDLLTPIAEGVVTPDHVVADLFALCRGGAPGPGPGRPTIFKSVGHATQDLAAAILAVES